MRPNYIYFVYSERKHAIKIGRSKNPEGRIRTLEATHGPLKALGYVRESIGLTENTLHIKFARTAQGGEWFGISLELRLWIRENAAKTVAAALPDTYIHE